MTVAAAKQGVIAKPKRARRAVQGASVERGPIGPTKRVAIRPPWCKNSPEATNEAAIAQFRRALRENIADVIAQVGDHDDDVSRMVFATHGKPKEPQAAAAASAAGPRTKPRRSPAQQASETGKEKATEGRKTMLEKQRKSIRQAKKGQPGEKFDPDEWQQ